MTSSTTGTITATGLASGLDVEGIVTKLLSIDKQPLVLLDTKEASFQAKLTALGTLSGAVSTFETAASALNNGSSISTTKASSSNTTAVNASAFSTAVPGSYTIETSQLAQAQTLVAPGQASLSTSLGTGTLQFDFGTISGGVFNSVTGQYTGATFTNNGSGSKTVTITAGNDNLVGIRDAINNANIGVTATIINDGSATPYRLALTSTSGAANSMRVSETTAPGVGLDAFIHNDPAGTQHLDETTTGTSAIFKINGLQVTQPTNTITNVINGVTLTLSGTNVGAPATISISKDSSAFITAVQAFAKSYNDLQTQINQLTKFDPQGVTTGILIGDSVVNGINFQIQRSLTAAIPGLQNSSFTNLTQVGVAIQSDGTLGVDAGALQTALSSNANDVTALFATIGRPSDSLVSYVSSTANTLPGNHILNVTAIATQGNSVGSVVSGTTITAGVNDTLSVTVDGVVTTVTIPAGAYTQSGLDAAIQSAINGDATLSGLGSSVAVSDTAGVLTVTSNKFGSVSGAVINGGNAAAGLFGVPVATAGVDAAGTLDGSVMTGSGQTLTSQDGLAIKVAGGATGPRGSVDFTQGYGFQLSHLASSYLGASGTITSETNGINTSINAIGDQRNRINTRLVTLEAQYRAEFTALEVTISNLQSSSNFLSQQLSALNTRGK
jgi:flagellar hook-associated protein 2